MSEQFTHTGVVRDIKEGRFDNQFDITFADGTDAQVYEKKKDGTESKVWPLILKSKADGLPYTWQGNLAKGRYRTITWGKPAPVQPDTWSTPTNGEGAAPTTPTPAQNYSSPATVADGPSVTHQIEAAWAVQVLQAQGEHPRWDDAELIVAATNLVILKRRVAAKLAQEDAA